MRDQVLGFFITLCAALTGFEIVDAIKRRRK